jgi:predicted 3-demethylubiquinone-9 3-methyltransferase (glyoxalase superfamily)
MPKIQPFLWFDNQAEEAMNLYVSLFPNSKILNVVRYGDVGPGKGEVMTCTFELAGQQVTALNGGPYFKFTEAVSFSVDCEDQAEVDYYWDRLLDGGQPSQCGWLKDRFGFSWQIVPTVLPQLIGGPDPARANKARAAMMKMTKLDIAALREAYDS